MRQNTVPANLQVRAQMPPDHAGVQYDDGDTSARMSSCWVAVYQCQPFLTTLSVNSIASPI